MRVVLIWLVLSASAAFGQGWSEPQRGTELRKDLMDAVRPIMQWAVGGQVQFIVHDLRVSDDVAFAMLSAQYADGSTIDMAQSPAARRGDIEPYGGDGPTLQALLQRSGRTWVAVHYAVSATDAWWDYTGFCPIWSEVIPEVCN